MTVYFGKATIECILAGSVCGVLYALFSGQPLNIVSATGPMLILESIISDLCMYVNNVWRRKKIIENII